MKKSVFLLADDKFVQKNVKNKIEKKSALDSFKFRKDSLLQCYTKPIVHELKLRFQCTPDTLTELAANIVKKIPLPAANQWTNAQVIKWIDKLGFPEYRNTFYVNCIDGHSLIYLDASALAAMNITKMSDIMKITKEIQNLYGIEMIKFLRSISLPPRYPLTHFKYYRSNSGFKYQNTDSIDLFRKMKLIRPPPTYDEHWIILKKWLMHKQPIETVRIGYGIKKTLYRTKRAPQAIKSHPKIIENTMPCYCKSPPCTCKWKEKDYIKSWRHSFLQKHSKLRNTDILINIINENDTCFAEKHKFDHRNCLPICTCTWNSMELSLTSPLTILKTHFAKKYKVFNTDLKDVIKYQFDDSVTLKINEPGTRNSLRRLTIERKSFLQSVQSIHLENSKTIHKQVKKH